MRISIWVVCVCMMGTWLQGSWLQAAPNGPEQWGMFEVRLPGPSGGNPFQDVQLSARFTQGAKSVSAVGFYDGDGKYVVRFMPAEQGEWTYRTTSNRPELDGQTGTFVCSPPTAENHGPVGVKNTFHFAYADGKPFVLIGTTCYSWAHQKEELKEETLASLKASPFNKVRMCVLPAANNPFGYPYVRDAAGTWDKARFDVAFFQRLDESVRRLSEQGVQADLIVFHPYHKADMQWFDQLDNAADDAYLRYVIARLSAYRNVWWSLGNEYGQIKNKTDADFDHFFQVVMDADPYGHLRSIHNGYKYYDANKPWVTHATIQNGNAVADFGRAVLAREMQRKPIVYDEVCYEGNIPPRWGRLSGEEMVHRFWLGTIGGTYVGHGDAFENPGGPSWIGAGGKLMGQSPPRLAFLRKILEAGPAEGIEPMDEFYESHIAGKSGQFYLVYFGKDPVKEWPFALPRDPRNKTRVAKGMKFHVDVIDTWNMTITPVDQTFTLDDLKMSTFPAQGAQKVPLPGTPYQALRIERLDAGAAPPPSSNPNLTPATLPIE